MGEAAALIAAFMWSATSVVMARLSRTVSPVAMSAWRLTVASVVLPLVLLISGQAHQLGEAPASAIIAMVGSGLLAYALGDTLYIATLGRLGVQRAFTLTMALFIMLTVAGGIVLLDEPFAAMQGVGAVLVAAGIYCIVRSESHEDPAQRVALDRMGYVLVVLVGIFWSAATLWLADGRANLGAIPASAIRTPAGMIGMVGFGLAFSRTRSELASPLRNRKEIATIAAIGIFSTLFGSLLYVYAVGEAGAARTTILNATSPLLALPLAIFFLKERFTALMGLGTAICVVGIILVVS